MDIEYDKKVKEYIANLFEKQYVFEVTKSCGYSEWVTVYKQEPIERLYKNIMQQFVPVSQCKIYAYNSSTDEKLFLKVDDADNTKNDTVCDFLHKNRDFFKPIYPVPSKVVYKLFLSA